MATTVQSRFAVLSLDDDEPKGKKSQKSTANNNKTNQKKKNDKPKQQQPKKDEKKKANKKKKANETQQWEQWRQKDVVTAEEAYKQELHEAILLSKLSFEEQVVNGVKDNDSSKKNSGKKSKKSTMSLEEFNNMGNSEVNSQTNNHDSKEQPVLKNPDIEFFDRIDKETKEEIIKSKEKDLFKTRLNTLDDDITSAQLKVEVEQKNQEILSLKNEVATLKEQLTQVKLRNKKLYQILAQGEMKDKAAVLAEVSKLQDIRDELTSEVTSLHAQLEIERSKNVKTSSAESKSSKQSNKKKSTSDNA